MYFYTNKEIGTTNQEKKGMNDTVQWIEIQHPKVSINLSEHTHNTFHPHTHLYSLEKSIPDRI